MPIHLYTQLIKYKCKNSINKVAEKPSWSNEEGVRANVLELRARAYLMSRPSCSLWEPNGHRPSQFCLHLSFSIPPFHHSNASTFCCSLLSLGRLFHGLTTLKAKLFFLISVLECFSLRFVPSLSPRFLSPSPSWNRTFGSSLYNLLTTLGVLNDNHRQGAYLPVSSTEETSKPDTIW
jgi:hypothetical protein